ncbi:helix-turn-helix transcriptional regulator [Mucilaginibacter sp. HC2]|uniref:helix-turn-helix domain-containing protein n=1 Tax=Mucilaginibacter TaxID=423349 RepID=UPI000DCE946F|nr:MULTISPECIES: AraC family transcriptional regulator [Mucilaginibacter]NHA05510.1 helix-turn-helix transcriptional regulator [Mucilaginibacter inviolabilis]QTE35318.1 AraC family transcriptional regulator [Mucilaginibacter gossypii]RAV59479.1 AraC family transcriptional regulator [Mucilaginibacter rubeus]
MKFQVYLPCDQLLPYVKHLIVSENEDPNTYQILPDTALVIGFQYRGKLAYLTDAKTHPLATAGITGLRDTYRVFQNTAGIGSVLVVFRETGAARFFHQPLHELFGKSLPLEHFFDASELAELEEKLVTATGDHDRIKLVEQFLTGQLNERSADLLVNRALEYIHQSKGTIRMSELASLLHTSASPLEKRFRQAIGASPKKFATIVRARNVLAAMERGNQDYAEYLSAFYDQAHFIKDFKKFAAVTPEQYLKRLK